MKTKNILFNLIAVVFWVSIWQILSIIVKLDVILPSPVSTAKALIELSADITFWKSCILSILRILTGLFSGALFAIILAYITYASKLAYAIFSPVLTVIKATPIASFIILALIWIGREFVPSFITFLIVLPIIWSSVYHGINNVDVKLKEVTKIFNFSQREKLKHLYFPSVFSSFISSFTTSIGIAWKAGVAAEVLCTPKYSIGTSIFESKKYIETPSLFAWTATVIILSLIIEKLLFKILSVISERSKND